MSAVKVHAAITGASIVACYAIAAFIAWDFNPARWAEVGRFVFAFCGLGVTSVANMVLADHLRWQGRR
jgi:uncharacterized membrane protein